MNKPIDNRNMALWERLFPTPPSQTKAFQKGGGFKGTAIKPFWCVQRMTEEFGPHGVGWGHQVVESNVYSDNGGQQCFVVMVYVWYMLEEKRHETGPQYGQTMMVVRRQSGEFFFDEEAPKKAITDGMVKCMSYLGLGGDVHLGMFDDSKYVAEQKIDERKEKEREEAAERKAKKAEKKKEPEPEAEPEPKYVRKQDGETLPSNGAHLEDIEPPQKFSPASWRDRMCAELKLLKTEKAVRNFWQTSVKPMIDQMLEREGEEFQKEAIYVHKKVKERLAEVTGGL